MTNADFAVAIFPFLKTSSPVRIGGYDFRSTNDVFGLPPHQATAIDELARMLFTQGDLRVKSASYAILPDVEVHSGDQRLRHLAHLRDVVAYLYAAPHDVFETVFLSPEEISLVLFTPSRVSALLTRPEHHTESVSTVPGPEPDKGHYVPGYNGLYNLRHAFWLEPGSRLYGPKPHMTLNISQDLFLDFGHRMGRLPYYQLVLDLLEKPETPTSLRIFSALHWFNASNENGLSPSQALLNVAVAFETLLRLPESSKTDRLVDAISLLLGRTERLDEWAHQFYKARSQVAHEGNVGDQFFYPGGAGKGQTSGVFGSLMLYGRQIFQLCVNTVLVGIDLAERADLREKLVSNNERFQKICELLQRKADTVSKRLTALEPVMRALERYRFVYGSIDLGSQLTAVRLSASALGECNLSLAEDLANAVAGCAASKRADGELKQLAAIDALRSVFEKQDLATLEPEVRVVRDLVELVWMNVFPRYYSLKEHNKGKA
ncbi:hypothetical protein IVA86_27360 [Bradyrhizobium sp. 146]|uniref:HEPN domain-containing protein n=1 Tax=Bradyrhizobium sp. 146 TaxID=2782622 RepID=UPI001FF8AC77|nr:HEPN domain-containing protein [Bradyrhizobium sp. 146]MCK1705025.1 hypothetical protein [Bradyrhizobium sp. 146]